MASPILRRPRTHERLPVSARAAALLAAGLACRGDPAEPCDGLGQLCAGEDQIRDVATRVDDALMMDLDGDGTDEIVALTRDARLLVIGHASGWRSALFLDATPVALTGLSGEVAVALAEPPLVAVYGLDATGRIEHRRDLTLDTPPSALWSGDLDGDMQAELLVAHAGAGQLTRLDPDSGAARTFAAGDAPVAFAVADLDGDARLDVVAIDADRTALQVLRGAGGGEFDPAREFAGVAADSIALADHDGDGDLDAFTRASAGSTIALHRNEGAGELAAPVELPLDVTPTGVGLVAGPAVPGGTASVSVPQGNVLGTWFGGTDGWLGHIEEWVFSVMQATWIGRGTPGGLLIGGEGFVAPFAYARAFAPVELWRDPDVHGGSAALATGHLDDDGRLDFAAAARRELHVYFSSAEQDFSKVASVTLAETPRHLEIADFTGDGRRDILLGYDDRVQLAQATEAGAFTLQPAYAPAISPRALTPLRTGPDTAAVVVAIPNSRYGGPPPNLGAAHLRFSSNGQVAEEHALAEELAIHQFVAVDLDADGVDEPLLLAHRGDRVVLTRMTPPGPDYTPGSEHDLPMQSGEEYDGFFPTEIATGDPDGDGSLDVWIRVNGPTLWVSGLEDDAPEMVDATGVSATAFRDIDGDGLEDAVYVGDWHVTFQRGHGDRTFDEQDSGYHFPFSSANALAAEPNSNFDVISVSTREVATHRLRDVVRPTLQADGFAFHGPVAEFVTDDVDRDGHTDIVTRSAGWGGGVSVLWGGPGGTRALSDGYEHIIDVAGLALGDLDGDEFPEILTSRVSWIEAYRFWPKQEEQYVHLDELFSLSVIEDLGVADVDADGRQDILALAYTDYESIDDMRLYVAYGEGLLQNVGVPAFNDWTRVHTMPGLEHASLSVGDVDDDGHLDLLVEPDDWALPASLVLADGPRAWAEPVEVPGQGAIFARVADDARAVDLLVSDGTTVARHADGALDRREVLVRAPALAGARVRDLVDLDVDGHDDLMIETHLDTQLWLRRGDNYRPALTIPREIMTDIAIADIDGDAGPDLVGLADGRVVVRLSGS